MAQFVAVVGARSLPASWAGRVVAVVRCLVGRGLGIGSGGALGADLFALGALVRAGRAACASSVIYLPGDASRVPRARSGVPARGPRQRVEAEIVRDIALAASGLLNPKVGGPSVYPPSPEFLYQPPAMRTTLRSW